MQLEIPDYKDNLPMGSPAQLQISGPAFAVRAWPSVAVTSPMAKGREAAPTNALYPDIQPLDFSTDDKLQPVLGQKITPGNDEAYPNCGQVRFTITCPDDPAHYKKYAKYSCHRSGCPTCWPTWASRLAKESQDRIDGSRIVLHCDYKARHVSLSPDNIPFNEPSSDCLNWLYKEGNTLTKLLGVTGCAVIVHAYRIRKDMQNFVALAAFKEKINRYIWIMKQENWQDYLYFSPHLHLLTFGNLMDSDDFHTLTGWVYRNHDDNEKHGRQGPELAKTVYYLLTHAWIKDNNRVVRYWGDLSNKKLQRQKTEPIKQEIRCPDCGAHCVTLNIGDDYQDLHNAPHAYRKIPRYIYVLRRRKLKKGDLI